MGWREWGIDQERKCGLLYTEEEQRQPTKRRIADPWGRGVLLWEFARKRHCRGTETMSRSIQDEGIPGEKLIKAKRWRIIEHHVSHHLCNIRVRHLFASQEGGECQPENITVISTPLRLFQLPNMKIISNISCVATVKMKFNNKNENVILVAHLAFWCFYSHNLSVHWLETCKPCCDEKKNVNFFFFRKPQSGRTGEKEGAFKCKTLTQLQNTWIKSVSLRNWVIGTQLLY